MQGLSYTKRLPLPLPDIAKLLRKWRDQSVQWYKLGGYYHEMRNIYQNRRASVVAHVTKNRATTLDRWGL